MHKPLGSGMSQASVARGENPTRVIFLSTLGSVCYGNICNGSVFRERKRTEHPDGVALRRRTELFSLRPCRAGLSPGNKSSRRVAKKSISRRLAKPFLLL